MTGRIFSIEEFSTFDGPGARCTVFLKGCPLRCQWCHNPEGQRFESEIVRSPNGCIGCGNCIRSGMSRESIPLCPNHLLRLCGEDLSPEELVQRLEPKIQMLNLIGGGITFSGGEPLSQSGFLTACLRLLQGKTHRAIQTSGFAPAEVFDEALACCDYMLFDLKLMDEQQHRQYTGVENPMILRNYRTLVASGIPFITRIPLIPGVNDTEANITQTASFMESLGVRQIELLPYNKAAGAKYKSVNRTYEVDFDQSAEPHPHREIFHQYNIEVNVL